MRLLIFFILISASISTPYAQPSIEWQRALGGSGSETIQCINLSNDGGYIAAGFTTSNNGDVFGNHGTGDWWVVKLDQTGLLQWQRCLGGSSYENANSVAQSSDGGYIVAGQTNSNNGDVSGNHGGLDYWLVKLSSMGAIEWQKTYGGSGTDTPYSIQQTIDGGFAIAGHSASTDGDVTGNQGYLDYWIVKLDNTGVIEWEKSLGGSNGGDQAFAMRHTSDGGYILAGESQSTDGDITNSQGGTDYWVVKLDSTGTIEWDKSLGGDAGDAARSIIQAEDGGYVVVGEVGSINSGQVVGGYGWGDYWVVKLSPEGDIEWQKILGGSDADWARSVCQAPDGGFVVPGLTYSTDIDAVGCDGADILVFKLNGSTGEVEWKKILGGSAGETVHSIVRTPDGGFILAGETYSNDGDVSGNHGGRDAWVVKLSPETSPTHSPDAGQALPLEIYPNPVTGSHISLELPAESNKFRVILTDLLGREVRSETLGSHEPLDIVDLVSGLYVATAISASGEVYVGKFVKE